jgi:hypothetical protein
VVRARVQVVVVTKVVKAAEVLAQKLVLSGVQKVQVAKVKVQVVVLKVTKVTRVAKAAEVLVPVQNMVHKLVHKPVHKDRVQKVAIQDVGAAQVQEVPAAEMIRAALVVVKVECSPSL